MKKQFKQWLIAGMLSFSTFAHADVNSDLNDFFNKIGGGSNFSDSGLIKAQNAGHLVGGAFYGRVPVRNVQLISLTLPEINSGCGGIDAYLGAFSFINADQLKAMGKAILSNAIGYAFELALETTCPQCKNVKDTLQDWANKMNNLNVSSCQAAQGIISGMVARNSEYSQYVCNKLANENNVFSDWAKSRQECGVGNQSDRVYNSAKNESQQKQVPQKRNVTWDALNKLNQVVSNDRQMKELMMSIVGTVVYGNKANQRSVLPPLGANDNLLNALLYGGEATFYVCDEKDKCLNPKKSTLNIQKNRGLVFQTEKILYSMFDNMKTDKAATPDQIRLVNNTRVPVAAYVRDVALFNGNSQMVTNLSEYLAIDYAIGYLDSLINVIEFASATNLNNEEEEKNFKDNLDSVRTRMGQMLQKVQIKNDAFMSSIKNLEIYKKQFSHEMNKKLEF